jgi:glycosyltransferase involved in cell wall biosynthesis
VIPHYDHVVEFSAVLPQIANLDLPIIIVDDGSPQAEYDKLSTLVSGAAPEAVLLRHKLNQGKGGSVMSGLLAASAAGYTHALQVDADGQHDLQSLPLLLEQTRTFPDRLICGLPQFSNDIPAMRYYARYLTLYLCWLETLGTEIRDALCGFRSYPLESVLRLIRHSRVGRRMAFDPEILVRARWAGIRLEYIPVQVNYPAGGRSHFHYLRDNLEISWMHTRLLCGMLLRLPRLLLQKFTDHRAEEPR